MNHQFNRILYIDMILIYHISYPPLPLEKVKEENPPLTVFNSEKLTELLKRVLFDSQIQHDLGT